MSDWDVVTQFRLHRKQSIKPGFGPESNHVLYQRLLGCSVGYEPESQCGVQTLRCVGEPQCHWLEPSLSRRAQKREFPSLGIPLMEKRTNLGV